MKGTSRRDSTLHSILVYLSTWAVVATFIGAVLFGIDAFDSAGSSTSTIVWAPWAAIGAAILAFNATASVYLREAFEREGRNVTAWVAAFIIFSPVLSGPVYVLTRRKPKSWYAW